MSYQSKREAQKLRRRDASERGLCSKCCIRPMLENYRMCDHCRTVIRERLASMRVEEDRPKYVDPFVHKQVRQSCYSLAATGRFDDGIAEHGEYVESLTDWFHERDMCEDSIAPWDVE